MTILLITAPSGAGKTTVMNYLQDNYGIYSYGECISHTTRPSREGEINKKTYHFIDEMEFEEMDCGNLFAEKTVYDGYYYGITKEEIKDVSAKYKQPYIIVNHDGYKQVKEHYPDAVGIFLHMSKEDCLANMLLRGDSIEKATKRIVTYEDEMKNRGDYDYVIKNVRNKMTYTAEIINRIANQNLK